MSDELQDYTCTKCYSTGSTKPDQHGRLFCNICGYEALPATPPPTDAEREELRYALWNAMHPDNDIDVLTDALLASGWRKVQQK